jgi:RimJ/RimL family protein N-acetyltransferase
VLPLTARPPELLDVVAGIQLRRARVEDADDIAAAVASSLDELRLWMPWADASAADPDAQRRRLMEGVRHWEDGSEFDYVVVAESRVIGAMGLHARIGDGALELGYWLRTDSTGQGIATESARALTSAALALPTIGRVEIHCDAANHRSAAIPRRLGYRLDRVEDDDITAPGESGRSMVWVSPPPSPSRSSSASV